MNQLTPRPTLENLESQMVFVEGGTFQMGGECFWDEAKPIHPVSLDSFYLGRYPVTQSLWESVMGENPSCFKDPDRPVERVSWPDCQQFILKLNDLSRQTYRLPTEAEWEYAARGGKKGEEHSYTYAGSDKLDEVAWWEKNSLSKTHPVGKKRPNELGLYDMSGNVCEWCQDWYDGDYYRTCVNQKIVHNPPGPENGTYRVLRGGGWIIDYDKCFHVSSRSFGRPSVYNSYMGFRLGRS